MDENPPIQFQAMLTLRGELYRVWAYLRWRQGRNEAAWPSQETVGRDLGLSVRHIKRIIQELEGMGWLHVEWPKGPGRGAEHAKRYSVTSPKKRTPESPFEEDKRGQGSHLLQAEKGTKGAPKRGHPCPNNTYKNTSIKRVFEPVAFELLWGRYPTAHRGDRAMAERAWNAALGTNGQQQVVADQILAGVDLWRDSQDWIEDHGKWIPRTARFISAGKWRGEPKGFAFVRDRTGCINCGGPADDFAYDRDGRPFCFCRKCQPRLSGQLQNQREAIPAMELVGKD